jgi:hypothetical protein
MTKDEIIKNELVAEIRTFSNIDDQELNLNFFMKKHGLQFYPNLSVNKEFSDCNKSKLIKHFKKVVPHAKAILEIGVHRNGGDSSTWQVDWGILFA